MEPAQLTSLVLRKVNAAVSDRPYIWMNEALLAFLRNFSSSDGPRGAAPLIATLTRDKCSFWIEDSFAKRFTGNERINCANKKKIKYQSVELSLRPKVFPFSKLIYTSPE